MGQDSPCLSHMVSKDKTPKSFQSKHPSLSEPRVAPSQMQLTDTIPSSWHQQGESTGPLLPLPVVSPVPPALQHRCYKQTEHPKTLPPPLPCPRASCRREVGVNISIPKVINSKPSPCRQETLRGLHLPVRRGIIPLEHVQLIILMGSILLFEIRMVCSSWGWYLLSEGPWCPRPCLTRDRAVPHPDPCPALSCSSCEAKPGAFGDLRGF